MESKDQAAGDVRQDQSAYPQTELQRLWQQRELFTRPAPEHEVLKRMEGTWDLTADFDFAGYGPSFHAEGVMTGRLFMGGRFLECHLQCTFAGQSYEQVSWTGFDGVTSKFQTTIIMASNNGMACLEGDWDPKTETIRDYGEISNAMFRTRHDIAMHRKFVKDGHLKIRISVPDMEGKFFDYCTSDLKRRPQ